MVFVPSGSDRHGKGLLISKMGHALATLEQICVKASKNSICLKTLLSNLEKICFRPTVFVVRVPFEHYSVKYLQ